MPYFCRLNGFPVELFHLLFNYFVAPEIYFSFSNISDYIDNVINSYSNHRLHLTSIRRLQFNLLCSRIRPEHVVSLVLSDGYNTPGLSQLFLSRYRLEQFTQLRSITLIHIHLRAFSFGKNSDRYLYSPRPQTMYFNYSNCDWTKFSRLSRLRLKCGSTVANLSFPHLRHLELAQCLSNELKLIFEHALQLRSLTVCLNLDERRLDLTIAQNRLTTLQMQIQDACKYLLTDKKSLWFIAISSSSCVNE